MLPHIPDYWWTCTAPVDGHRCLDRMTLNVNAHRVERDRDAHISRNHPGWQPSAQALTLSHWP